MKALEAAIEADRKKAGQNIPYTLTRMIGTRGPEKKTPIPINEPLKEPINEPMNEPMNNP